MLYTYCTGKFKYLANVLLDEDVSVQEIKSATYRSQQSMFMGLSYVYNITGKFRVKGEEGSNFALVSLASQADWRSATIEIRYEGGLNRIPESFSALACSLQFVQIEFCSVKVSSQYIKNYFGLARQVLRQMSLKDSQYNASVVTQDVGAGVAFEVGLFDSSYLKIFVELQAVNECVGLSMFQRDAFTLTDSDAYLDVGGRIGSFLFGELAAEVHFTKTTLQGKVNALHAAKYTVNITDPLMKPNIYFNATSVCVSGYQLSDFQNVTTSELDGSSMCFVCPSEYNTDIQAGQCCPEYTPIMGTSATAQESCFTSKGYSFSPELLYKIKVMGYHEKYGDLSVLADSAPTQNVQFSFDTNFAYMLGGNISMYPDQLLFHNVSFVSEMNVNNGARLTLFRHAADGAFYSHVHFNFERITVTKDACLCLFQHVATNVVIENVFFNSDVQSTSEGSISFIALADGNADISKPTRCFVNTFDIRMQKIDLRGSYVSAVDGGFIISKVTALTQLKFKDVYVALYKLNVSGDWGLMIHDVHVLRAIWFSIENMFVKITTKSQFSVIARLCETSDIIARNLTVIVSQNLDQQTPVSTGLLLNQVVTVSSIYLQNTCANTTIQAETIDYIGIIGYVSKSFVSLQYLTTSANLTAKEAIYSGLVAWLKDASKTCQIHNSQFSSLSKLTTGSASLMLAFGQNTILETKGCDVVNSMLEGSLDTGLIGRMENCTVMNYNLISSNNSFNGSSAGVLGYGKDVVFLMNDTIVELQKIMSTGPAKGGLGGIMKSSTVSLNSSTVQVTFGGTNKQGGVCLGQVESCQGQINSTILQGLNMTLQHSGYLAGKIIWSAPSVFTVNTSQVPANNNYYCLLGAMVTEEAAIPVNSTPYFHLLDKPTHWCITEPSSFIETLSSDRSEQQPCIDDVCGVEMQRKSSN